MKTEENLQYLIRLELARKLIKDKEKFYRLERKLSKARKK